MEQITSYIMNACNNKPQTSKWQRSAIHISDHIEGCERMLDMNEKLLRVLKSKYQVSHKQIILVMETMVFIEKEVVDDIDKLDVLADRVLYYLMEKEDGHVVVALIPTIKEIKGECNRLMCRLAEHKREISSYERKIKRSQRVVVEKKRRVGPVDCTHENFDVCTDVMD